VERPDIGENEIGGGRGKLRGQYRFFAQFTLIYYLVILQEVVVLEYSSIMVRASQQSLWSNPTDSKNRFGQHPFHISKAKVLI